MSIENRGGFPVVRRLAVTTAGFKYTLPSVIKHLQISNEGGSNLRVYFNEDDFTADRNYVELAATTGFFDGPTELQSIWLRASGGTSDPVVLVFYSRRG